MESQQNNCMFLVRILWSRQSMNFPSRICMKTPWRLLVNKVFVVFKQKMLPLGIWLLPIWIIWEYQKIWWPRILHNLWQVYLIYDAFTVMCLLPNINILILLKYGVIFKKRYMYDITLTICQILNLKCPNLPSSKSAYRFWKKNWKFIKFVRNTVERFTCHCKMII